MCQTTATYCTGLGGTQASVVGAINRSGGTTFYPGAANPSGGAPPVGGSRGPTYGGGGGGGGGTDGGGGGFAGGPDPGPPDADSGIAGSGADTAYNPMPPQMTGSLPTAVLNHTGCPAEDNAGTGGSSLLTCPSCPCDQTSNSQSGGDDGGEGGDEADGGGGDLSGGPGNDGGDGSDDGGGTTA